MLLFLVLWLYCLCCLFYSWLHSLRNNKWLQFSAKTLWSWKSLFMLVSWFTHWLTAVQCSTYTATAMKVWITRSSISTATKLKLYITCISLLGMLGNDQGGCTDHQKGCKYNWRSWSKLPAQAACYHQYQFLSNAEVQQRTSQSLLISTV